MKNYYHKKERDVQKIKNQDKDIKCQHSPYIGQKGLKEKRYHTHKR